MKLKYIAIIALWMFGLSVVAQNETDAFRYAQYSPTGSARYIGTAGSMGGFGADFSVLSANNPAGIGLFKRTEITFTPALSYDKITADYNGQSTSGSKYNFGLNNLGFVFVVPLSSKWKSFQMATGYTNLARYNSYSYVKGPNYTAFDNASTYFDVVAASLSGTHFNNISEDNGLGFYGWLAQARNGGYFVDTIPGKSDQYAADNEFLNQKQTRETKGYLNEYVFSGGANYDDKLFLGVTIGIPFFNYTQKTTYTESANYYYDSLTYYDEFQAKGAGVNLKLGVLYQPVDFLRFGLSFHTPTLYNKVKESYKSQTDVRNFYVDDTTVYNLNVNDGVGHFEYQLITPYHIMGNLAFLFGKHGFVNLDYEYVDYATSNLQSPDYGFDSENNSIKQYYKGVHNIRIGGEVNLSPVAFRLGYAFASNPYVAELDKNGTVHTISAGVGFKTRYFFMDFAYRYRLYKDKDIFYDAGSLNPYTTKNVNNLFALTFGWKIGK